MQRFVDFSDADAELGTDARRRLALACYYGLVLVFFSSDHGDNQGVRGLWNKSMLYRESTEVPMILAGPGVPQGRVCSTLVNLVDIAPTVLDVGGVAAPPDLPGRSLLSIACEADDPSRVGFSEYHAVGSPCWWTPTSWWTCCRTILSGPTGTAGAAAARRRCCPASSSAPTRSSRAGPC
ncbi:MAG: sulfatase-like hydrolase/transferase [Burkholderiales bacterium]|nr:sulfatase-like hydrolase/transferase [Burkholderiales bacterium]